MPETPCTRSENLSTRAARPSITAVCGYERSTSVLCDALSGRVTNEVRGQAHGKSIARRCCGCRPDTGSPPRRVRRPWRHQARQHPGVSGRAIASRRSLGKRCRLHRTVFRTPRRYPRLLGTRGVCRRAHFLRCGGVLIWSDALRIANRTKTAGRTTARSGFGGQCSDDSAVNLPPVANSIPVHGQARRKCFACFAENGRIFKRHEGTSGILDCGGLFHRRRFAGGRVDGGRLRGIRNPCIDRRVFVAGGIPGV